jgi:curved DNA-binding protein CbpA
MHQKPSYQESLLLFNLATLRGQTEEGLRKIYYRLAKRYHPDKGGDQNDFIRLREAFSLLKRALSNPPGVDESTFSSSYNDAHQHHTNQQNNGYGDYKSEPPKNTYYEAAFERLSKIVSGYEDIFNTQIRLAQTIRAKINEVIEDNQKARQNLDNWLDSELEKLNQIYYLPWWQRILPSKTITAQEYVYRHNELIRHYNNLSREVEEEFTTTLLNEYQDGINNFLELLEL